MGGIMNACRCTETDTPAGYVCATCGGMVAEKPQEIHAEILHSCDHGAIVRIETAEVLNCPKHGPVRCPWCYEEKSGGYQE